MSRLQLRIRKLAIGEDIELENITGISIMADDTIDPDALIEYTLTSRNNEETVMRNVYNFGGHIIDYMKITAITATKILYFEGKYLIL